MPMQIIVVTDDGAVFVKEFPDNCRTNQPSTTRNHYHAARQLTHCADSLKRKPTLNALRRFFNAPQM
jgi:hypothetical protein